MSVLIKDMEMPTSCTMCWLNTFCGVWATEPVKHKGFNERLDDCPLTELIRCKDCTHQHTNTITGMKQCLLPNGYTPLGDDNDYCSYAERRGEE